MQKRKRVPMRVIRALVKHIAEQFDPEEIILFGSYAYGTPQPWSDVDLLVIKDVPEGEEAAAKSALWEIIPKHTFGLDILLRSREVIERRVALGDWFLREITSKGRVMYRRGDRRQQRRSVGQPEAPELGKTYEGAERIRPGSRLIKESRGMNELAAEWVSIAEADFDATRLTLGAEKPLSRIACFHAQQCAEKYLKAFLTEKLIEFPRRHPLMPLMELCLPVDEDFEVLRADLKQLEAYAVDVRYPDGDVTPEQAEAALAAATRVREFVRGKLGLA